MLNTVNVIEIPDTSNMSVHQLLSFHDNAEGNKEAESAFCQIVRKNAGNISDEDMDTHLENGYYENSNYYCALVHSTPKE